MVRVVSLIYLIGTFVLLIGVHILLVSVLLERMRYDRVLFPNPVRSFRGRTGCRLESGIEWFRFECHHAVGTLVYSVHGLVFYESL